jgi:hypothetical protein
MRPSLTSQDSNQQSFNTSPKYMSVLPKSALDIEVISIHQIGEGAMYDEQIFLINVHCDAIYYSVERSYIDFVEMYTKIKKRFPQCEIPLLPLDATIQLQKSLNKDETRKGGVDHRRSLSSMNSFESPKKIVQRSESTSSPQTPPPSSRGTGGGGGSGGGGLRIDPVTNPEELQNKIPELQIYMRTLLTFHEIVVSEEFFAFLDEERPCNHLFNFTSSQIPNEIDLLLV